MAALRGYSYTPRSHTEVGIKSPEYPSRLGARKSDSKVVRVLILNIAIMKTSMRSYLHC